jgi:hypothetical protein
MTVCVAQTEASKFAGLLARPKHTCDGEGTIIINRH